MTEQDSTLRDIILGVVSSMLATILYQLGYRGFVYVRSKKFRKARSRFVRNTTTDVIVLKDFIGRNQHIAVALCLLIIIPAVFFLLSRHTESSSGRRIEAELAALNSTGNLSLEGVDAKKQYEDYLKFLNSDRKKYAKELSTVNQLQNSEVEYRLTVGGTEFEGVEGNITTDGERINIAISNVGGSSGEKFSLNSRLAHEFEHARQFDSGELTFVKTNDGKWHPNP